MLLSLGLTLYFDEFVGKVLADEKTVGECNFTDKTVSQWPNGCQVARVCCHQILRS